MSYGPNPWQQASWDWRAAVNFMAGGMGCGLIVFAALASARGMALALLMAAGLALVALGLFAVWLEIGRPWRALNVLTNWRRSWMSREAWVATGLFGAGVAAAAGWPGFAWAAAVLAIAFVYCQARILQAAKGIPAWREPWLTPFLLATALVEGGGLFWVCATHHGAGTRPLLAVFGALVIVRMLAWLVYRRQVRVPAPPVRRALDEAGRGLQYVGTLPPLLLVAIAAGGGLEGTGLLAVAAAAGICASAAGAWSKWSLITRAGFNQGFALAHLPVRGTRR